VTFIPGAIAWFITRKLWRIRYWPTSPAGPANAESDAAPARQYPDHPATAPSGYRAAEALARHPASQSRNGPERTAPIGPDDDPEFLRMLDRLISGSSDPTELEVARIGLPGSRRSSALTVRPLIRGPYRFVTRSRLRHGDRSDLKRCARGWNHSSRDYWRRPGRRTGSGRRADNRSPHGLGAQRRGQRGRQAHADDDWQGKRRELRRVADGHSPGSGGAARRRDAGPQIPDGGEAGSG
jgi:hypothetical protein